MQANFQSGYFIERKLLIILHFCAMHSKRERGVATPIKICNRKCFAALYGISCAFSTGSALSSVETLVSTGGALWALPSSSSTSDASIQFSVT